MKISKTAVAQWGFPVLFVFLLGCAKPEAPEYLGFQDIAVSKMDARQSTIRANVKFYNPNTFKMQLKKADIQVFLNDKAANHYVLDSTIDIHPKDSFWIPVALQLDMNHIFTNAIQSLLNDQLKIRLEGYARIRKGAIAFRVPIHYEETEKLSSLVAGMN